MITFEQLKDNERCVYQAFSKLSAVKKQGLSGSDLGKIVNGKGYDADDDMAVAILADFLKMKAGLGGNGEWFKDEVRFDANTEIIASVNSGNDCKRLFDKFGNGQYIAGDILYYSSKNMKNAQGHVIYGETDHRSPKVESQHNLIWTDKQHQRDKGPLGIDYVVYYEKKCSFFKRLV
jgi:hypothetical protein